MEFKGTKGEWEKVEFEETELEPSNYEIQHGEYGECVSEFVSNKYDALLISKAPILLHEHYKDLEFLEKIANYLYEFSDYLVDDVLDRIEFKKQLIKQATEL